MGKHQSIAERLFVLACIGAVFLPLTRLAVLIGDVVIDGLPRLSWAFIKNLPSRFADRAGIRPALVGSLYLIGLTGLIALPIGVGSAVYLEEYGKRGRLAAFIEVNIANLAGVPSVIYGLLGLGLFVRYLGMGRSLLAGACTLALLILPIVITAAREALRTVPDLQRQASLALGATRLQTIRRIVLPMALPGILTGSILSISRAMGETAPLIVVGAATYLSFSPDGLNSPFTALPIQVFNWTSRPQAEFVTNAAAGIVVLLVTLLSLNLVAIIVRNKYQKRS